MSTTSHNNTNKVTVLQGRAMVRLIEAIDVLLTVADERESIELRAVQAHYRQRLRQLVAELPPVVSAQILVASEQIHGPAGDVTLN